MTSYPSMYNITPSIFMTSYPIRMLSPYCFHDKTSTIPDMSPTIFDITATVSVSSPKWHTHLYRCITVSMISQVCKSSQLAHVWHCTKSTSHHIHSLWYQWSCFMTSQTLHSWHQMSSIWHHIHSLGHHTTLCMTSIPLYLTSHPLYLCHHTHHIDDITATIWMVSDPVYLWHHIPYIYDIIPTKYDITTLCVDDTTVSICVTSFALQVTLRTLYHPKPHYLWCHIHFRHDITSPVSDIAPTVFFLSVYQLYHNNFLYDITHNLCMTSQSVGMTSHEHFMTSHPIVMTSQRVYFWHHKNIYIISTLLLSRKHNNYTCHLTHYIWHHSLCICAATPAVLLLSQ